ncbi:MAG: inorganic phosphate transporter [Acidobacteria bacterium]|nr:inorganic phosphate transporter [Acidobacteriota bacterium]
MTFAAVLGIGLLLAYANGANDTYKGVATLLGSGTASYRGALLWATVTTALGSLTALVLARGLLAAFAGNGLVPAAVVADPVFPTAVALAAGLTVLLATRLGFPLSTTHALLGGLVGAGLVASPSGINTATLATGFMLPLLTSPLVSVALSGGIYPVLRAGRRALGITRETCVCVGDAIVGVVPGASGHAAALQAVTLPSVSVGDSPSCRVRYSGRVLGLDARTMLDIAHYTSAGAVSFARGLNDTPKIAALLLMGSLVTPSAALMAVGLVMATGGLISARRVAATMSHGVTGMNPGQGFTANAITSALVIGASTLGLPVSTTHVSCGALFGIGTVTRQAHWHTIRHIVLAWVVTLPVAALLAAVAVVIMRVFGG